MVNKRLAQPVNIHRHESLNLNRWHRIVHLNALAQPIALAKHCDKPD